MNNNLIINHSNKNNYFEYLVVCIIVKLKSHIAIKKFDSSEITKIN